MNTLSESSIVNKLASQEINKISKKVIRELQRIEALLSGDDTCLKTAWDEICVQVQDEMSFSWDAYEETVEAILHGFVSDMPRHVQEAIWLQTDAGIDWLCEEPEKRDPSPVNHEDIVKYIASEYIFPEAGRWSNKQIRTYIERSAMRDWD
ncbi:MAG: hypothetical protein RBR35_16635 [Salinivirgaceae bacterium]|nr:hypothetical protein [Salinivirgaceae bacterium]